MLFKALAVSGFMAALAIADGASDVVQLKKDTFDDFIKANDLVLAECKQFTHQSGDFRDPITPLTLFLQSSLRGAATARLWPPSTKRLPRR